MEADELNEQTADEQTPAPPDSEQPEVLALRAELAQRDQLLASQQETQGRLLERVRVALLATEPDIEPDLVAGSTLDEIEASFEAARAQVERVRDRYIRQAASAIPAGAPGRLAVAPGSAIEKIRAGLAER